MRKKKIYKLFVFIICIILTGCGKQANNKKDDNKNKTSSESVDYEIKEEEGKVIIKVNDTTTQVYYHDGKNVNDYEIYLAYKDNTIAKEQAGIAKRLSDAQSNPVNDYIEARGKYVVYNYKEGNYNNIKTYEELQEYAKSFNVDLVTNGSDEKKCQPQTGGLYNLVFNTNGGNSIEAMSVCLGCAPNTYKNIPTPTREGYKFLGWYYDVNLENAISASSTYNIKTKAKKDGNDCIIGYEEVTLYAKWEQASDHECIIKSGGSFKLIFNTNGGNSIEAMSVCLGCAPNTYKSIPTPTREGYKFLGWYYDAMLTNKVEVTSTKDIKSTVKKDEYGCVTGHEPVNLYAKWGK